MIFLYGSNWRLPFILRGSLLKSRLTFRRVKSQKCYAFFRLRQSPHSLNVTRRIMSKLLLRRLLFSLRGSLLTKKKLFPLLETTSLDLMITSF